MPVRIKRPDSVYRSQISPAAARRLVADRLGSVFEKKASDDFCLKLARVVRAGRESAGRRLIPRNVVIELDVRPTAAVLLQEMLSTGRQPAPAALLPDAVTPAAWTGAGMEMRRRLVAAMKAAFAENSRTIQQEMERGVVRAFAGAAKVVESRSPADAQVTGFWLDQTIRTPTILASLAEVVEDKRVLGVDLPRRIEPEMLAAAEAIGLPAYQLRHHRTGSGVVVGVFDGEVNVGHPALGHVKQQANLSGEPWGRPDSHATAVAGIVGALHDDYRGVAPEAIILNYKVTRGIRGEVTDAAFSGALQAALDDEVDVVNCSWGMGPAINPLARAVRACNDAWDSGLTIVKSAGNGGPDPRTITNPGQADGVIVVGATNADGTRLQSYSSRGPTRDGRRRPHVVVPSGSQAVPLRVCRNNGDMDVDGGAYGTSFAAPVVTGILALLKQAAPEATPNELRETLLQYCTPLDGEDPDGQGAGIVRLDAIP